MKKRVEGASGAELRQQAELRLRQRGPRESWPPHPEDATKLVHELQVHQIELEMQNEELRHARAEAGSALSHYAELYDFAPVGYFTLGRDGTIAM